MMGNILVPSGRPPPPSAPSTGGSLCSVDPGFRACIKQSVGR